AHLFPVLRRVRTQGARRPVRCRRPRRRDVLRGMEERRPDRPPRRPGEPPRHAAGLRRRGRVRWRAAGGLVAPGGGPAALRHPVRGTGRPAARRPAGLVAAVVAAGRPPAQHHRVRHPPRGPPAGPPRLGAARTAPGVAGRPVGRGEPVRPHRRRPAGPRPPPQRRARHGEALRQGWAHRRRRAVGAAALGFGPPRRGPRHHQL
ncbi:MAG: FIG01121452: hypothetical protein, partial [uncultured Blastococcus sp.]